MNRNSIPALYFRNPTGIVALTLCVCAFVAVLWGSPEVDSFW